MAIKVVEDVLVPGVVPLMDYIFSEKVPSDQPGKYSDYVGLGLCLAGYALAAFGIQEKYTKNIGIASLDWAVNSVRNMVKGGTRTAAAPRLVMRPAARPIATSTVVSPRLTRESEEVSIITP
jgi:hypothetical protein